MRIDASNRALVSLVLVTLAAATYANALANGFVLDDRGIILQHPLVQEPSSAWRAFVEPYWPRAVGSGQYRPLGIIAFALDHAVAGNTAAWFHAVNVGWHAIVTLLVYRVGLGLLAPLGAAMAAAVFAVHPVHVEAVANVVGRLELMAAAFGLGALLLHRRRHPMAIALYAAALCSKESAIVIPALAVLDDLVSGGRGDERRPARTLLAGYGIVTVAWGALLWHALDGSPISTTSAVFADQSLATRWRTVLTVVPHYVRLFLVPAALSSDYEPGVITPATSITPAVLLGAVLLAGWAGIAFRAWRTDRGLALGLCWVPVALAPVSNVLFATGIVLAERTLYLPSVGVALLAGWMADRVPAPRRREAMALAAAVLVAAVGRTWTRTPAWHDARTHAMALLESHPESYRGHWVAARVLDASGNIEGASREYALARRAYPSDPAMLREAATLESRRGDVSVARILADSASAIAARRALHGGDR